MEERLEQLYRLNPTDTFMLEEIGRDMLRRGEYERLLRFLFNKMSPGKYMKEVLRILEVISPPLADELRNKLKVEKNLLIYNGKYYLSIGSDTTFRIHYHILINNTMTVRQYVAKILDLCISKWVRDERKEELTRLVAPMHRLEYVSSEGQHRLPTLPLVERRILTVLDEELFCSRFRMIEVLFSNMKGYITEEEYLEIYLDSFVTLNIVGEF